MQFRYSSYTHPAAECLVTYFGARRIYTARGVSDRIIKRMLVEGEVIATSQATIESRRDEIENAYRLDGGAAVLLLDSGATAYQMDDCRVVELAWLQEEAKAHFATALPFRITLESEELSGNVGLLSYTETISLIGDGGPRIVWPELQNGQAIPQITASNTNVLLIQSGDAAATGVYPSANQPLFGPPNLDSPSATLSHNVLRSDIRTIFTTRWNYSMVFNAAQPLPFPIVR